LAIVHIKNSPPDSEGLFLCLIEHQLLPTANSKLPTD
jgi:hypothetical protein